MIILDTDVISAIMRPELNPLPIAWLDKIPRNEVWTTAVNILESYGFASVTCWQVQVRFDGATGLRSEEGFF